VVEREWLDDLPTDDPRAIASRRDLKWINRLMGSERGFARRLRPAPMSQGSMRIVEWGAGDGALALRLCTVLRPAAYRAVDIARPPKELPDTIEWVQKDVLVEDTLDGADTLCANLLLHHFTVPQLRRLGESIQRSSVRRVIAHEPLRARRFQRLLRCGVLLGFNAVTLHDGVVSVAAGFSGNELADCLGLEPHVWEVMVRTTCIGGYWMEARRR
jgi:hypothetical protein